MTADAGRSSQRLVVGVIGSRIRELSPAARTVHKAILRAFATTGRAPALAGKYDPGLLRELHERDVVRLDGQGGLRAAYPFSGVPTAHLVSIADGPTVWAMCAIDALGIADMLGKDTTITSADPASGEAMRVSVHQGEAAWEPDTAVVLDGMYGAAGDGCCPSDGDDCVVPAADRCCGVMNFFASRQSAIGWLDQHPHVSGVILAKKQALRLGVETFGHLLAD